MTPTKKILIITPRFPYPESGACEQDRAEGIRQLQRLGFDVQVIGMFFDWQNISEVVSYWQGQGIAVHPIQYRYVGKGGVWQKLKKILFVLTHPWYADGSVREYTRPDVKRLLEERLDAFDPDYVWFDYTYLWPLYRFVKKRNIPVIVRSINFEADHFLDEDGRSLLNYIKYIPKYITEKITARDADLLFSINPNEHKKYISVGSNNVINVPLRALQHKLDTHTPRDTRQLHVFFSGSTYNVSHNRRALEFIIKDIAPAIHATHPGAFIFHITGSKFPDDLKMYVKDNVVYEGFVDNMDAFLEDMDIALVPSFFGAGMQQKIFEPLARGFPTITHARGLGGYAFTPGRDVLIADTLESFVSALEGLTDLGVRHALSKNAKESSAEQFSSAFLDKKITDGLCGIGKHSSLLIIAQTVDALDSNLGFFCSWIQSFATHAQHVYVIANKVGEYDFPKNVTVVSLGKEKGRVRVGRVVLFWRYLFQFVPRVDATLAHMCPEYVVYGGWLSRIMGKPLGLWYLHKSLTWKLRLAVQMVNYIFTAHEDGFPLHTNKLVVTGHGIDTALFDAPRDLDHSTLNLLTVGRISKSKNLLTLVKSAILLTQKLEKKVFFDIIGEPYLSEDTKYLTQLQSYVDEHNASSTIRFAGKVNHEHIPQYLAQADVFLNASSTGGIDKAVLEAFVAGVPVVTSNSAFRNMLQEKYLFREGDPDVLAERIIGLKDHDVKEIQEKIKKENNLENTIKKISKQLI
jgi:glycosyltransferase involved in cell wall biosynthesis